MKVLAGSRAPLDFAFYLDSAKAPLKAVLKTWFHPSDTPAPRPRAAILGASDRLAVT